MLAFLYKCLPCLQILVMETILALHCIIRMTCKRLILLKLVQNWWQICKKWFRSDPHVWRQLDSQPIATVTYFALEKCQNTFIQEIFVISALTHIWLLHPGNIKIKYQHFISIYMRTTIQSWIPPQDRKPEFFSAWFFINGLIYSHMLSNTI